MASNKIRTPLEEQRTLRVPTIQRSGLFASGPSSAQQLDGAIGLLASHNGDNRGASVASVWAAAEGLLGRPGGKGPDVADRLSDIVACSYPRAEVGALAKSWAEFGEGPLAEELHQKTSTDQARLMSEYLIADGDPAFKYSNEQAATARYLQLTSNPAEVLLRVRGYYNAVFRRLYYQRNFIMHAAKFDSVTLAVSVRTAPLLIAAAPDRLMNAQHANIPITPLGLAARAENELALVGQRGGRPLYMLLD